MMIIRLSGFVQINRDCFIRKGETFEEVRGKQIRLRGHDDLDLFAHKVEKAGMTFWVMTEAISGCRIGKLNKSLKKLMEKTDRLLSEKGKDRVEFLIREKVNYKYISPRYRFVANPNSIVYVATKKHKNRKPTFPRRYRIHVRQE